MLWEVPEFAKGAGVDGVREGIMPSFVFFFFFLLFFILSSSRFSPHSSMTRTNNFGRRYDRQRTLAIRITEITLASDAAITIVRFRPSKRLS